MQLVHLIIQLMEHKSICMHLPQKHKFNSSQFAVSFSGTTQGIHSETEREKRVPIRCRAIVLLGKAMLHFSSKHKSIHLYDCFRYLYIQLLLKIMGCLEVPKSEDGFIHIGSTVYAHIQGRNLMVLI